MKIMMMLMCGLMFLTGCATSKKQNLSYDKIDQYSHRGEGYDPFLITSDWQVAQLNHVGSEGADHIKRLDVHHRTDEAFYLMKGSALLIAAGIVDDDISYDMQIMEPGKVFNIRQGVWHSIVLNKGAEVLIIENENTHLNDCEYYPFNETQKREFMEKVEEAGWSDTP